MGEQLVIRGVPESLARDGWWFLDSPEGPALSQAVDRGILGNRKARHFKPLPVAALAVLVVLADSLFWDTDLGISIALYAVLLSACMIALKPERVSRKEGAIAMVACVVLNLPAVEQISALSLMFSGSSVVGILVWFVAGRSPNVYQTVLIFLQANVVGPLILPMDAATGVGRLRTGADIPSLLRTSLVPVGVGAVFFALFVVANPIFGRVFDTAFTQNSFSPEHISRGVFLVFAACLAWPYVNSHALKWHTDTPTFGDSQLPGSGLINAGSVRISLVLFNAIFALQTLSDIGVLSGGMSLPEGMTYAQYAHQGAYPLLAAAFLSGLFAVITHAQIRDNSVLRGLMFAWLGQTMFLVVTAALRLSLYVEAYSLTYLRIAAFIWMGLILVGLALIIVQTVQNRTFTWLLRGNAIATVATLYVCCFVNFTYLIVDYNMHNTSPETLDLGYLCNLGEHAIPPMMEFGQINDQVACGRGTYPALRFDPITDWQEWGFRRWRLQRYLETYHDL